MKSINRLAMQMAATAMLVALFAVPAGALLSSTSFGFPSVFQSGTTTAFSRDTVTMQDLESLDINFGAAGLAGPGCGFGGFPSISQTVDKSYYADSMDYYHTEETAAFNYPYANVGTAGGYGLPGLGGLAGLGLPYGIC